MEATARGFGTILSRASPRKTGVTAASAPREPGALRHGHEVVRANRLAAVLFGARRGLGDQPVHPLIEALDGIARDVALRAADRVAHLGSHQEDFLLLGGPA